MVKYWSQLCTTVVACLLGATEASSAIIEWRLINPFRYFRMAADTEQHIKTYQALFSGGAVKTDPILQMERTMSALAPHRGWAWSVIGDSADEQKLADDPCWYENAKCDSKRMYPREHAIVLTARVLKGTCTWRIGNKKPSRKSCKEPFRADIPYPAGARVILENGGKIVEEETIIIRDLLVVGIGDSFASGEGNPDRPVTFAGSGYAMNYGNDAGGSLDGYPRRLNVKGDTEEAEGFFDRSARWTHRTCHRSLYSYQLRVAMQLAIDDPKLHTSITYLGLGCTGTEITGLFRGHKGRDNEEQSKNDPLTALHEVQSSQLSAVSRALCRVQPELDTKANYNALHNGQDVLPPDGDEQQRDVYLYACRPADRLRSIDVLLLSIGGNDVGFSGLVSNAALEDKFLGLPKLFDRDPRISPARAVSAYMPLLLAKYDALASALKNILNLAGPDRVFLTAYPEMAFVDGKPCPDGRDGMDVTPAFRLASARAIETEEFIEEKLNPLMKKAAQKHGWTFVDGHRKSVFLKHGICAVGANEVGAEQKAMALRNNVFPREERGGNPPRNWFAPYEPNQFKAYASRKRWFRTPNDSFLTVHYHDNEDTAMAGGRLLQLTSFAAYGGAFHPTAEGHAAIADAVYNAVRQRIPLPSK